MKFQIFNFFWKGNDVWKCILNPAPFTLIITFYSSQTLLVVYFHEADIYTFYFLVKGIHSSKFTHGYLLSFYFESVVIMISDSVNVSTVITYKISTSVLWCYLLPSRKCCLSLFFWVPCNISFACSCKAIISAMAPKPLKWTKLIFNRLLKALLGGKVQGLLTNTCLTYKINEWQESINTLCN